MKRRDLIEQAATLSGLAAGLLAISYSLKGGNSSIGFVAGLVAGLVAIAFLVAARWSTGGRHLALYASASFFLTAQGIGWATGLVPASQVLGYTVGVAVTFLLVLSLSALVTVPLQGGHGLASSETRKL